MKKLLTSRAACEHLGIDGRTLRRWIVEGLPVAGSTKSGPHGGRPSDLFDVGKLESWAGSHGKNPKGIEGRMLREAFKNMPLENLL